MNIYFKFVQIIMRWYKKYIVDVTGIDVKGTFRVDVTGIGVKGIFLMRVDVTGIDLIPRRQI